MNERYWIYFFDETAGSSKKWYQYNGVPYSSLNMVYQEMACLNISVPHRRVIVVEDSMHQSIKPTPRDISSGLSDQQAQQLMSH